MSTTNSSLASMIYRCAGPNCGQVKGDSEGWWLMWTSFADTHSPLLYLAPWDEAIACREGTLPVCGEMCAQRLQSQFMGNIRESQMRKE